jgi:transposase
MTTTLVKYSLGLDASKAENQACLSVIDSQQKVTIKASRKFANTPTGFKQLIVWLEKQRKQPLPLAIVLEATGIYHESLAWFLHEHNYALAILLPNKAKNYLRAIGQKSKNDKIDAAGLARMGAEQHLELWQPCSKELRQLKALTRHYEQLQQMRTTLQNQLHAVNHGFEPEKLVIKSHEKLIEQVEKQITLAEKQLEKQLEKDAVLKARVDKIVGSIKGLGTLTVLTILAETAGFSTIRNQRQLASYAGYDVVENQSGKRSGKTRISKKGNSHIRRILHMPALNMVRYEVAPFKALYDRIYQKTGIKMKGYTAIQRKLLLLIYTLWKKDEAYVAPEVKEQKEAGKATSTEMRTLKKTAKCLYQEPLFQVCRPAASVSITRTKKIAPAEPGLHKMDSQ